MTISMGRTEFAGAEVYATESGTFQVVRDGVVVAELQNGSPEMRAASISGGIPAAVMDASYKAAGF